MTASPSRGEIRAASAAMLPWKRKTVMAENATPTPREEAKMTALMPSSSAFANNVEWSPVSPSCSAPTIAMAPTQNRRLAATKPSDTEAVPPGSRRSVFFCTQSPRDRIRRSKSSSSPSSAPRTMERMEISMFCPFRDPLTPI
ncbi:hypothetical protein SDC9_208919 [bioreactor metagenome]|uniref:Uncharacterized protein n=1 Tax=bioreactor metagenome TaxID=1076179 RepID=A0A645JBU4_9ZZZZ